MYAVEPDRAVLGVGVLDGGHRISPHRRDLTPIRGHGVPCRKHVRPILIRMIEQLRPQARPPETKALPARHGPERQMRCAPCQGLRNGLHEEQVRRAREDVPTRLAVPVHGALHRQ